MKARLRLVLAAFAAALFATSAFAAGPTYKIEVSGLACPFCAYGIEKQLDRIDGVTNVRTDIAKETVTVTMEDGKTLDKQAAEKAVKDAGFTMHGFEQVPPAGGP